MGLKRCFYVKKSRRLAVKYSRVQQGTVDLYSNLKVYKQENRVSVGCD